MTEFMNAIETPEVKLLCVEVSAAVMAQNYYQALMACKKLLVLNRRD